MAFRRTRRGGVRRMGRKFFSTIKARRRRRPANRRRF